MNFIFNIRERINRVGVAILAAVFLLGCGAVLAFVMSPRQALKARRIERLPEMAAEDVSSAASGDDILITGRLEDNPIIAEGGFVAYTWEEWLVTQPTPGGQADSQTSEPAGKWETIERVVPELTLEVGGRYVQIHGAGSVATSGSLHELLIRNYSFLQARYNGEMLAEGSERVRGFYNGDLVSVLGVKASVGGVIPDEIFMGDRVAFIQHQKNAAKGLFICGLCMMGFAPIIMAGGILAALFGRRR